MKKFFISLLTYFVFALCFFAVFGAAGADAVFALADNGNTKEFSPALYKTKEETALAKKTAEARIKAAREAKKKAEEEISQAEEMKRRAELEEKKIFAEEKKKEREKLRVEAAEKKRKEAEKKETALREKKASASAKEKSGAEEKKRGKARKKADGAEKARLDNAAREKVKKDKDGLKSGRDSEQKQSARENKLKKEAEKTGNKRDDALRKEKKSAKNEKREALPAAQEEKTGYKTVPGQGKEDAGKKSSEKDSAGSGQEKALTGETAENQDEKPPETGSKETVRLSFVLPQKKLFADGSNFVLTKDGIREVWKSVDAILLYIEQNPGKKYKIYVEGYSDSSGGERINRQYSLRRAEAVAGEMAGSDINNEIIETKGLGAVNFVNKKNTMAGVNRRVEIKLVTIE